MEAISSLFSLAKYLNWPHHLLGWAGLGLAGSLLGYLWWISKGADRFTGRKRRYWLFFLGLSLPLTNLFLGLHLSGIVLPPWPGLPFESPMALIMPFSAIPWMLAAGIFGPKTSATVAFLSTAIRTPWETHDPFHPFSVALCAFLYSAALRQRYRTPFFRWLRNPFAASLLPTLIYPLIFIFFSMFLTVENFAAQLNYALSIVGMMSLCRAVEWLIGGSIAALAAKPLRQLWMSGVALFPSPTERSLGTRALTYLSILVFTLATTLIIGEIAIATHTSEEQLEYRLSDAAMIVAEKIPYFLEAGQNLMMNIAADPALRTADQNQMQVLLAEKIRLVPFFNQLTLYSTAERVLASYPDDQLTGKNALPEEQVALKKAFSGVPFQLAPARPQGDQWTAQISFIHTVFDEQGNPVGVLVGRSHLGSNPFIKSELTNLQRVVGEEGEVILLDDHQRVLVHKYPLKVISLYDGSIPAEYTFFEETASDGMRYYVYYQRAIGRPWSIILKVPVQTVKQQAMGAAIPLLALILSISLSSFFGIRVGLRSLTASLNTLSQQATDIAQGKLDQPLPVDGIDEIGRLRQAFERMRAQLKKRLDEATLLQKVSQSVASSFEIADAVQPILEAVMSTGANVARVVLLSDYLPGYTHQEDQPICFGLGASLEAYSEIDKQVLALARHQERLVLSDVNRPRLFDFPPGGQKPQSLFAAALRHEEQFYGALWCAFEQTHSFSEEEVRFLVTLAGYAAIAAANTHLFQNAETERQRLNAIINSSPDAMLVIDEQSHLILTNPAANELFGLNPELHRGIPFHQVITHKHVAELLFSTAEDVEPMEIGFPNGRIYIAMAAPVQINQRRFGRICILRDITHFKELERLKSDLLTTVSHDLRVPLKSIHGYATMLEMVGALNEKQGEFVHKILHEVEELTRMVENLLDLERIEKGIGLKLESIPVRELLERIVGAFSLPASQKNIQIKLDLPPQPLPPIEADRTLIQRALHNLLDNAIKFTRPHGLVIVRARARPIGLVFEVVDNGVGISPMDKQRIFEKFYRGQPHGTEGPRGSGLGLAIVKSVTELHGGKIWVDSQLGKGSAFYIAIPFKQEAQAIKR